MKSYNIQLIIIKFKFEEWTVLLESPKMMSLSPMKSKVDLPIESWEFRYILSYLG